MKNIKLSLVFLALISFSFLIEACNSNSKNNQSNKVESEISPLIGKWKLVQEKSDVSSDFVINFEEAGFFEENTILNDPKFAEAGIDKIQPISKGQWTYNNEELILEKFINQDSVNTENFTVKIISANKITLKNKKNKKNKINSFIKYTEK